MQLVAGDRLSDGPFDQVSLQEFSGDEGLQRAAVQSELSCGIDRSSIDGPDHNCGKSKISPRSRAIGKPFDAEHLRRRVSSSPEGETGQRPPIMSV